MNKRTQRGIRDYLRQQLGTWPEDVALEDRLDRETMERIRNDQTVTDLLQRIRRMGELFVGMANGPFLLAMKANDPQQFINYADLQPTHNVHIVFDRRLNPDLANTNVGVQVSVRPAEDPEAYTLWFGLPNLLREYLLADENRGIRLAPGIKRRFFSEITIYRRVDDRDRLYRLTYEPQALRALPPPERGEHRE